MNTCSAFLVRVVFIALASAWISPCAAQGKDGGLTSDFKKLSPKERSKIAAQETEQAAADSGYQHIMQQADVAFRAGRYEDALAAFEEARTIRPYNVYPKVKIQDLQALIKRRDQELAEQKAGSPAPVPPEVASPLPPASPEPPVTTTPPTSTLLEPPQAATAPPTADQLPKEAASTPPLPEEKIPVTAPTTAPATIAPPTSSSKARPAPTPAAEAKPVTIGERIYMEAGATVIERTVEDEGRPVVYKKVVHAWGQTFHFKDGLAISEREWTDRFNP